MLRFVLALDALHRSRRALADLPPTRLADLGIAPDEARRESMRPVWDGPLALRAHGWPSRKARRTVSGRLRPSCP